MENRVPVASFGSYPEAQRAVDYLSDQRFPVEHTMIVGVGLRMVEQVLGRLTFLRAAAMGAASGAWFGLLIGIFLKLFTQNGASALAVVVWAVLWAAAAGAAFGVVSHAFTDGQRDFVSARQLIADRYEVFGRGGPRQPGPRAAGVPSKLI
jgi:hypothetical protein